jgi:magnesium transporter
MIHLKYHPPGTAPGTLSSPGDETDMVSVPPTISLIQYDASQFLEKTPGSFEELDALFSPQCVNWIHVSGLGDPSLLEKLAKRFHIHRLSLEDVVTTSQRPKAEAFPDHYFVISEMIYSEPGNRVAVEQISMFFGSNFVLTLRENTGPDVFDLLRRRLRTGRGFARRLGADYLAYALLDSLVDQFFPILEGLGDVIEEIENILLEKPARETLRRLYECKRLLLQLRRAAWPQREIFGTLMRDEGELVSKETRVFLRDCYDHSTQIIDIIESYRDLSAGLMDVYLSSLGFRTNEIMRVLTIVSVLFIPLTFLAGVYGMNFQPVSPWNMPELRWPLGYVFFWGLCLLIVAGMLAFFRRKRWV